MRAGFIVGADAMTVLACDGAPASVTGTTAETVLASVTLPGGLMGPRGHLRLSSFWSETNNANTKTIRARLGGILGATILNDGRSATTGRSAVNHCMNRGDQASQWHWLFLSLGANGGGAGIATAIDTSVDQLIVFTGQLAVGTDSLALNGFVVEVIKG